MYLGPAGHSGFSKYEYFGILTANRESNFGHFFVFVEILGKNGKILGIWANFVKLVYKIT